MAALDPYRRHSSATSSSPSSNPRNIPPAPPLPPDHPHRPGPGFLDRFLYGPRRATNQLISQHLRDVSTQSSREAKAHLLFTQNFGHAGSQSTSHRTGLKLRALDINESRSHVVLAGVKILKTVRVQQGSCTEDVNIRSAAVNYVWKDERPRPFDQQQDIASAQRETFDIEDVAWSNQQFSSNIATAASNGKIMLYDLNRPGVEVGRLYEHHRQVHKVDFNPHEGQFLLSGSQDGTVRLWDLRSPRRVIECKSKDTFPGRSDGIRHTKWSPANKWSFALGTDNGTIQRWDVRQNRAPVLKILAHTKTCTSIDWHPDGRHMISASKDQDVKVWDLQGDRKQKPAFEVRCPKPVQNVRWRPPCYVADASDQWVKQCTHFATSYRHYPLVHVWDLRRPFMPYREFHHGVNSGTTDLMWHSQDLLWTVGPEGEFSQSDVRYMPRVADRRPMSSFTETPAGNLSFFSLPRPRTLPSSSHAGFRRTTDSLPEHGMRARHSGSPNMSSSSLGRAEEAHDERFLSSSLPKRHSRSSSFRSAGSMGTTPPSYEDLVKPVTQLNKTMSSSQPPESDEQICAVGLEIPRSNVVSEGLTARCWSFNGFSQSSATFVKKAACLGDHFLRLESQADGQDDVESAQTFAFLRLELDRVVDLAKDNPAAFDIQRIGRTSSASREDGQGTLRPVKPTNKAVSGLLEDGSGVATPLARPLSALPGAENRPETPTIDLGVGRLQDSPEFNRIPRIETTLSDPLDSDTQEAGSQGADHLHKPREPLRFDQLSSESYEKLPLHQGLDRRGSSESFQLFPTSWGADGDEQPVIDSAASSWTRNAAQNFDRHPSFHSQTSFESATSTSRQSSGSSHLGAHTLPDAANHASALEQALTRFEIPESAATSAESDAMLPDPLGEAADERQKKLSSPSATSHDEIKTVLEDSIASLPAPSRHPKGLLVDAPQHVQQLLETLQDLLNFHSNRNEAPMAGQLFLAFAPLLPYFTASILAKQSTSPRTSFNELLCHTLNVSADEAALIQNACHVPLEAAGLSPLLIESMLNNVHEQFFANSNLHDATLLRRLAYPAFPAVYEASLHEVDVATACSSCGATIANVADPWQCETCRQTQGPCPICLSTCSPFSLPAENDTLQIDTNSHSLFPLLPPPPASLPTHSSTTLYTACSLCGHTAHLACAHAWFVADAGDACPVPGCGCDCVPGPYRAARIQLEAALRRERGRVSSTYSAHVKRDSWDVGPSKAVGRVGHALRSA